MPKVTQKGQVTIPHQIRSLLSIKTGDEVIFQIDKEKVLLKKREASIKNISKYIGFLSHLTGRRIEEIICELRGNANDIGD